MCSTPSGRTIFMVSGMPVGGSARAIAQQRRHIDRLARTIDAALGVDEAVERAGRRAAGDAAIGQVEGAGREVEEGIVAARGLGDEDGRRKAAFAARETRLEMHVAAGVVVAVASTSLLRAMSLTVAPATGAADLQRAHEAVDAVIAT